MVDTHYLYRPKTLTRTAFAEFAADVSRLREALPGSIRIHGFNGTGEPEIGNARVVFNGDRATGLEHEPLVIEQEYQPRPGERLREGRYFSFVKTMGKPYDLFVVAVLY